MEKHEILSPQSRAALFDPPTDPAAIVRHYTFSSQDLALIRQRRRAPNRLGFAAHLALLKFPGRVLGAASQATIFAIGCADLVLVPIAPSAADIVEAIKTVNLIRSASAMMRREVVARVVLTGVQPGTNIAEHVEKEVAKAGLPVLRTRLHRLVAFQEMSFTGFPPTSGNAGVQCSNFLDDLEALGGLPEATKLAS